MKKRYRVISRIKLLNIDTNWLIESDEHLGFIVGYTSNGVPYGLTHEEWDKVKTDDKNEKKYS